MEHKESKLNIVPEKHSNNQNTRPRINKRGIYLPNKHITSSGKYYPQNYLKNKEKITIDMVKFKNVRGRKDIEIRVQKTPTKPNKQK